MADTISPILTLRRGLWAAVAIAALAIGGTYLWQTRIAQDAVSGVGKTFGDAAITNAYTLTDHTGQAVTAETYALTWQLVFFGFTHCPDICPTTLSYMAVTLDELGPMAEAVTPIFITVDPERDDVDVMASYAEAFHPRLQGLTGTVEQTSEAARNFRVYFESFEDEYAPDGYTMAHADVIYLMRPDGSFEDVIRVGNQSPTELAERLTNLIQETS